MAAKDAKTVALSDFRARCAAGECLVVFDGKVLNLTRFKKSHPGGELVVDHLKGLDATDAMIAYHPDDVLLERIPRFSIGTLVDDSADSGIDSHDDEADAPAGVPRKRVAPAGKKQTAAEDASTREPNRVERAQSAVGYGVFVSNNAVSKDFRALNEKLKKMGFYETDYTNYLKEIVKYTICIAIIIYTGFYAPRHILSYAVCAMSTAFMWQQLAFVGHDIGHNAVFHNYTLDFAVGSTVGNVLLGVSLGWWKKSHNVHHIVTNSPQHDPDIQHLPFFAVSTRFFSKFYSSFHQREWDMEADVLAQLLVSQQHHLYYPILCFARFFLYVQTVVYICSDWCPYRPWEIATLSVFVSWQVYLLSHFHSWSGILLYVFMSHALTMILHLQITLSHFAMPTEDPPECEDWSTKALRTSLDVECPEWLDWFHGGLQFQVEHHMFPRIARHKLRAVRPYVADLAHKHGLTLHAMTFTDGNVDLYRHFKHVSDQMGFAWARIGGEKVNVAKKLE